MEAAIKSITVKHPCLGEVEIHSDISEEMNDMIGSQVSTSYSDKPIMYYGDIVENEDGTFWIGRVRAVREENIGVGWISTPSGGRGFVTLITNRVVDCDDVTVYPSGVLSVVYK